MVSILDTYSRRIVGWSMENHMRTELVVDALETALWRRKPSAGLVHHSDRGAQYTAISFGRRLEEVDLVPSMGRTGTALDNAMAESFIATLNVRRPRTRFLNAERGRLSTASGSLSTALVNANRVAGHMENRCSAGISFSTDARGRCGRYLPGTLPNGLSSLSVYPPSAEAIPRCT
jgi:transposase InsO family protein